MLNTYPLWKYALIVAVLAIGGLFAAPNLYPPDFAIQVAPDDADMLLSEGAAQRALSALDGAEIEYFGVAHEDRSLVVRVRSNEDQILGRVAIQDALGDEYVAALNLAPTTPDWLAGIGASPMKYGLDLSGGVHFLLEVDIDKAVSNRSKALEDDLKGLLREKRIRYQDMRFEDGDLRVGFRDDDDRSKARALVLERFREFLPESEDVDGRPGLVLAMPLEMRREIERYAISQNLQSLRNRVNELGVSEPLVQSLGSNRIVVDLPGVQDSSRAKIILGKVANLDFRLVATPDALGSETETYEYEGRPVVLERRNIVTGDRVANALHDFDSQTNMPQVSITLDGQGGDAMHRATRYNIGRSMAIILKETKTRMVKVTDDSGEEVIQPQPYETKRLISVATIQAALGSRFRITGLSQGEARLLALLLRAGALAAPMYIVEERTVGASLGEENINRGFTSIVIGFAAVLVFMLIYYKLFGLAANIALTVNLVLLIALMSLIGATLTLPGIAGIVLTVGMAVDANVLIFSRIKEELRERPPQQAIHAGFERALVTILDANITTFIVAVILYAIGTGAVKGFAVTLMVGIMTSMFTAIMGTRALVNLMYGGRNVERLAI
ncbi:MAG: protein translocase subunit SecD [Pseudomonadales bacterium]